jgi:hypothetical protein
MLGRVFLAALIAAGALLTGQSSAFGATPDVNDVACSVTDTVNAVKPSPAPVDAPLLRVYRNTAGERSTWENATYFNGSYHSRAGGNDVVVEVAVPGSGYSLNIYRGHQLVASEPVSACDPYVTVPLPAGEDTYSRSFRYQSGGATGPATTASFTVDTTAPVIAAAPLVAPGTAEVTFSEPILEGTDYADDWYIRWAIDMDGATHTVHTRVDAVTPIDNVTRRLSFNGVDESRYLGVDYLLSTFHPGERYRDAAGNPLADTVSAEVYRP